MVGQSFFFYIFSESDYHCCLTFIFLLMLQGWKKMTMVMKEMKEKSSLTPHLAASASKRNYFFNV